ncbi:MAG: homocysteine S-methyltransferase family protein [Clostridia bacterium]|nr:homocysteine S-methyltransferase family protein [Clostridia bacterium]
MSNLRKLIKTKRLYCDGGTGTVLQSMGLPTGTPPEVWNIEHPERITELHKGYLDAGCNIITTNTFGVNCEKYENYEELIERAIRCAKSAAEGYADSFVAFDMGPTGRLLKPLGDLDFEDAVSVFSKNVQVAAECGADLILIETMNDSYETKAAVLAAKENCDLPIFVTNVYDESGKLMTGATPEAMIAMLESLGVDALGMNCSLGPDMMLPLIERFVDNASVPIIVNPNAGLPVVVDGKTAYNIDAVQFAEYMKNMAELGACILGGCCGTTPEYMKKMIEATKSVEYKAPDFKSKTVVSSYTHAVEIGNTPVLIGERINPTGKAKLKEALRENNMTYILNEALRQEEAGVHILDVNTGLPEIDEAQMLKSATEAVQAVTDIPLQLDSNDPDALEGAMRIYNGKPLVNSVNGKAESMESIFPLVKKYGGAVIALTIDENGIPETAEGRRDVAKKIVDKAAEYGIDKKDIIVDPLALTVSSDSTGALVTMESIRLIKDMGLCTSLGVSNISFGLPNREKINSAFFAQSLECGLDCAIMNPFSVGMMDVYYSHKVLHNMDTACAEYIEYANSAENVQAVVMKKSDDESDLHRAIVKGIKEQAVTAARLLLETENPLDVINEKIIPALNEIGVAFEEKRAYLPQLLMSAEAASAAFDEIKTKMPDKKGESRGEVILATVKGDIHDIGKNIVKVLLESYGFTVFDLGRDVAPEAVLEKVKETGCRFVGLSALMTTTVPAMETTIKLLHEEVSDVKIVVGGAVLNPEYAQMINADFYAADAMETVHVAEKFYS